MTDEYQDGSNTAGRILVVDDDRTFTYSTAALLDRRGYSCLVASDGADALRALEKNEFDLVISDIQMPGNDDLAFVKRIAETRPGLPVILVTGQPTMESALESFDLPVHGYLVKPIDVKQLELQVASGVQLARRYQVLESSKERLARWRDQIQIHASGLLPGRRASTRASIEHLTSLTLENIIAGLMDLNFLVKASHGYELDIHQLQALNSPELSPYRNLLKETVAVIEKTKSTFKSKELGELRTKIETFLKQ